MNKHIAVYIHTMEYSAVKRNNLSIYTTIWINLKITFQSGKKAIKKSI